MVHASHVGPVEATLPATPFVPWRTEMLGDTQICAADGTQLARLTLEDGEGHIAAEVELGPPLRWMRSRTASGSA